MSNQWQDGDFFKFHKSPMLGRIAYAPDGERLHIPYVPAVLPVGTDANVGWIDPPSADLLFR
jgi:hypothetical protein